MSTNRDFERITEAWLADGPTQLADRVLDAALDEVHATRQRRRLPVPWRFPTMSVQLRLAAAAVIGVLAVGFIYLNLPGRGDVGGPSPTTQPTPTAAVTSQPSPNLLDTATWTTYVSDRYGFSLAYPADWRAEPADHDWAMATDGADVLNTAAEAFIDTTPDQGIRVSVWSVAVEPGTTVETWLQAYCTATGGSPCTDIMARSVAVTMDGFPGVRPTLEQDTQAYFLIDNRVYGVVIWRTDADPSVAKFGGGIRLLDAILSTMRLLPGGPAESPSPS